MAAIRFVDPRAQEPLMSLNISIENQKKMKIEKPKNLNIIEIVIDAIIFISN
jgi:hypothetical protein